MVNFQRCHFRLIAGFISAALVLGIFLVSGDAYARKERMRRHYLSWESLNRSRELKTRRYVLKGERQLKVSKRRVVRLKKSSFWNRKPVQFSTPVIAGDRVFLGVDAGVFYGIDRTHLKKLWKFDAEGSLEAGAVVDEDQVYFGDEKGFAYALSKANGGQIWKVLLDAPIASAPLILGNQIFFLTNTSRLFSLKKDSGAEVWHTGPAEKAIGFSVKRASDPVLADGLILYGTDTGLLTAYYPDGRVSWAKQLGDRHALISDMDSKPLVERGRIYVTTADQRLFCVDLKTGSIIWSNPEIGGANDVVMGNGKLYVSGGGILSAVNPDSGGIIWQEDFETPEISSPAVGSATLGKTNIIAVVSTKDKLYLLDSEGGDIMFEHYVRRGSFGDPVFVDNNLYVTSNTGRLYTFQIAEKQKKAGK